MGRFSDHYDTMPRNESGVNRETRDREYHLPLRSADDSSAMDCYININENILKSKLSTVNSRGGITPDTMWIEQQRGDLMQHRSEEERATEISNVDSMKQPSYRQHALLPAHTRGSRGIRRTYYFLEVTSDGLELRLFHTKELLAYVQDQNVHGDLNKAKTSLQLRDIRQVFGGITRYTIEPRGNCILINLCKFRCIIFKDRALFMLFAGGTVIDDEYGFRGTESMLGEKYTVPIYRVPKASKTGTSMEPVVCSQSTEVESAVTPSRLMRNFTSNFRNFSGGILTPKSATFPIGKEPVAPRKPQLSLDEFVAKLDMHGRKELLDVRAIADQLHAIIRKDHGDTCKNSISLENLEGTALNRSPLSSSKSGDFSGDVDSHRQIQIDKLSEPPKERDMIEIILLETCRVVWANAFPLIERARMFQSNPIDHMSQRLSEVQQLKKHVDSALDEIKGVRTAITELLDESEDLEALCLTVPYDKRDERQHKEDTRGSFTRLDTLSSVDCYDALLRQTREDQLNEMELMLECYLQEIEAMHSQLKRVDETTDDVLHFLQLHLATIRNSFLRLEVVMNIMGVVFASIGAYAGVFGMNLQSGLEAAPHMFWRTAIFLSCILFTVTAWMVKYMSDDSPGLPTDMLFKRKASHNWNTPL